MRYVHRSLLTVMLILVALGWLAHCGTENKDDTGAQPTVDPAVVRQETVTQETGKTPPQDVALPVADKGGKVLLITQSEFKADDKGMYTVPDAAVLLIAAKNGGRYSVERLVDPESNVFHKALMYDGLGIVTLGGNEAKLKIWKKKDGSYKAETVWHPTFGGKHNRLRDFEMADFDGDGLDDLAIATHDQGVVAVAWRRGDSFEIQEIDRSKDTFVHEIEIGDLDGDGKKEIYSTPSEPNSLTAKHQGGRIMSYEWNGKAFDKSEVVSLDTRHMKEVLVADLDLDGKQELYAALEAETEGPSIKVPVEIRRFDLVDGKFKGTKVTDIQDRFCRFLVAGDIDHDGKVELVASAFSAGVWMIKKDGEAYSTTLIDKETGGFEHAAYIADIELDGKPELYIADDKGGVIRRYDFQDGSIKKTIVSKRLVPAQAMTWNITSAQLP